MRRTLINFILLVASLFLLSSCWLSLCFGQQLEPTSPNGLWLYDPVTNMYYPVITGVGLRLSGTGGTTVNMTLNEITGAIEFDQPLSADSFSIPLPSAKGSADTQSLRNSNDVPVIQYTPTWVTTDIYMPNLPDTKAYASSITVPRMEMFGFVFHNTGATTATTLTLPAAEAGMKVGFYTVADYDLTVQPNASDVIDPFGIVTAADTVSYFSLSSGEELDLEAVGDFIQLLCLRTGHWAVVYANGSIVDD
jgi:hypothetical protein